MEHGHGNPNLKTEPSENYSVAGLQDEGVDTNIAGSSESKESLLIKLEIDQNIETTKLKNSDENNAKTLEFGNNNIIEIKTEDKESEKNYTCKFCSQGFDKHQALGGHMNGHSKDQRNIVKFGKVTSWIHATYPPPLNTTLASETELQNIPTNGAACNSPNHLVEVSDVYCQLGGQQTNQQSTQQIQLSQGLQVQQQKQQPQYYQAQQLQHYQYSQGLQTNQVQSTQALQSPQNYRTPQRLQNYQVSQGSQSYQAPQQFQNYQAFQGSQNYQAPQPFQNHQALQGSQNYQAPQGLQCYQTPQGLQYYQAPQRFQNYQAPQGPQSYQIPQGSQNYQAPQGSQIYQASQRSQSYQTSQGGPQQQLVAGANSQQNINLNSKTSNKPKSPAKVPSNEHKSNSSNSQGSHFQAQGPQRFMPNPLNLRNGDRLTRGPFINEQSNKKYYAKFGPNVFRKSNQMINTSHNYDTIAQYIPTNTFSSFNQSKVE